MKNKILIISLAAIIMAAAACTNSGKNDSSTPSGNETASENKKLKKQHPKAFLQTMRKSPERLPAISI